MKYLVYYSCGLEGKTIARQLTEEEFRKYLSSPNHEWNWQPDISNDQIISEMVVDTPHPTYRGNMQDCCLTCAVKVEDDDVEAWLSPCHKKLEMLLASLDWYVGKMGAQGKMLSHEEQMELYEREWAQTEIASDWDNGVIDLDEVV